MEGKSGSYALLEELSHSQNQLRFQSGIVENEQAIRDRSGWQSFCISPPKPPLELLGDAENKS